MTAAANLRKPFLTTRPTVLRLAGAILPGLALIALAGCHRDRQAMYYAPAPAPAYAYAQPTQPVYQDQPAPEQPAYYDQGQFAQPAIAYAMPTVVTQQVPVYIPQPVPLYVENTIVRDRVIVKDCDDRDRRTNNDRREANWNRYTPAPVTRKHEPVKTDFRAWNDDRRITTTVPTAVRRKPEPVKTDFRAVDRDRRTTASSTNVTKIVETTRPTPLARIVEKVDKADKADKVEKIEKINVKAGREKVQAQVAADTDRLDKKDRNRH